MSDFPPGIYERLLSEADAQKLQALGELVHWEELTSSQASRRLAETLASFIERALNAVGKNKDEGLRNQLDLCNALIDQLVSGSDGFATNGDRLRAELLTEVLRAPAVRPTPKTGTKSVTERPSVPLSESALFVNAHRERNLVSELRREIVSADAVDLLCPFLFWQGYVLLRESLRELRAREVPFRVLTSTYSYMTQARVLDDIRSLGGEVKVSYEQGATRLHAKAWFFRRESGYSTAFVGSSNLSHTAQTTGLEWNVRLSQIENRATLDEFRAAFENYWNSGDFEAYDPEVFRKRTPDPNAPDDRLEHVFRLRPFSFQQQILDRLAAARSLHDRHQNLVVAATGTGKTVIAALDYRRLADRWAEERDSAGAPLPRLLFVAHRKEILVQARTTYRHAVGNGSFGELLVDGALPRTWDHVFASVQSLKAQDLQRFDPEHFDVLVVDETHHAAESNDSYTEFLNHFRPRELLGLTATPERSDGQSILERFGGSITAEIRLWDAIDRGLLVPFQYFAVHDTMDLQKIPWRAGRYDQKALSEHYARFAEQRLSLIAGALQRYVEDPQRMRALGFCVSVAHAEAMAASFNAAGLSSRAISGKTSREERSRSIAELRDGDLVALFSVDVFNEGLDIPEVDTVLFLRPTESATLFTQQLGRGLRRPHGTARKRCLTVLDFVGQAHESFRFDLRFRVLTGQSRRQIQKDVKEGFPHLPAGCGIQLDEVSREIILDNLAKGIGSNKRSLVNELRTLGPKTTLAQFLEETEIELSDLYRSHRSFTELRRATGFLPQASPEEAKEERKLASGLARLIHVDDRLRLRHWREAIAGAEHDSPHGATTHGDAESEVNEAAAAIPSATRLALERMLASTLMESPSLTDPIDQLSGLSRHPDIKTEIEDLLGWLDGHLDSEVLPFRIHPEIPLSLHARYHLREIMAAFGATTKKGELYLPREGVYYHEATRCNLLFVTLTKSEDDYSPTTMYNDYALSTSHFHWQSQSRTRPGSEKGQRHIEHDARGITPLLFVRTTIKDDRRQTVPYTFLGPARIARWEGERPMNIEWQLETPMPPSVFRAASIDAG